MMIEMVMLLPIPQKAHESVRRRLMIAVDTLHQVECYEAMEQCSWNIFPAVLVFTPFRFMNSFLPLFNKGSINGA
ncbi:MAG: hypothetical protein ACMUIL_08195 [bacterium]